MREALNYELGASPQVAESGPSALRTTRNRAATRGAIVGQAVSAHLHIIARPVAEFARAKIASQTTWDYNSFVCTQKNDAAYLRLLCNSPIATVVTDPKAPDNPIVAVNAAFEALTGYSAADVSGRNCRLLAGSDTAQEGSAILRDAIRMQRPALAELTNYRSDGTPFRNAVMIAPLYDDEGNLRYFVGSQMEVGKETGREDTRRQAARILVARLTPRQKQVLREMMDGHRNKQIAARLGLSEKTVKMHRARMLAGLQAISSTDAVRIAMEAGL